MKSQTSRIAKNLYIYVCSSSLISCHLVELNCEVEDKVVCFLQKVTWAFFTSCKRDTPPGQLVPPITRYRCPQLVFSIRLLIKIPLASYKSKLSFGAGSQNALLRPASHENSFKMHIFRLHARPTKSEIGVERSALSSDNPSRCLWCTLELIQCCVGV